MIPTSNLNRRPIPRRVHDAAQQHGHIRDLACSEDGRSLQRFPPSPATDEVALAFR